MQVEAQTQTNQDDGNNQSLPRDWRYAHCHPKDLIIGDPSYSISTRASVRNISNNLAFIFQIEPKSFKEAEQDESWILVM